MAGKDCSGGRDKLRPLWPIPARPARCPAPELCGSAPGYPRTRQSRRKNSSNKIIPALATSSILPLTNPLLWTQAQRTFGRVWFGFLAGRCREGPKRTDGRTRSQAFHVAPGKPGGAPVVWRTREVGRKSGSHFFGSTNRPTKDRQTPARDAAISQKPRMHGAMIASYTKISVRSAHCPMPSISTQSEAIAVGGFRMRQKKERPPHQPAGHPLPGGARVKLAEARR